MKKTTTNEEVKEQRDTPTRRPYTKPGIVSGEVFETMALSCGSGAQSCAFPPVERS